MDHATAFCTQKAMRAHWLCLLCSVLAFLFLGHLYSIVGLAYVKMARLPRTPCNAMHNTVYIATYSACGRCVQSQRNIFYVSRFFLQKILSVNVPTHSMPTPHIEETSYRLEISH